MECEAKRCFWFRILSYHVGPKQSTVTVVTSSPAPDTYTLKPLSSTDQAWQYFCWKWSTAFRPAVCFYVSHRKTRYMCFQEEVQQQKVKPLKGFEQFNSNSKVNDDIWAKRSCHSTSRPTNTTARTWAQTFSAPSQSPPSQSPPWQASPQGCLPSSPKTSLLWLQRQSKSITNKAMLRFKTMPCYELAMLQSCLGHGKHRRNG